MLPQFLQLGNERRKVTVARHDHKRVDVLLRIGQIHGVDAQPDVGGVLARLRPPGNLDQLDGRFVQLLGVARVAVPVGIGLLGDDLPFFDHPLEHPPHIEPAPGSLETERQIFEVDEEGEGVFLIGHESLRKGG